MVVAEKKQCAFEDVASQWLQASAKEVALEVRTMPGCEWWSQNKPCEFACGRKKSGGVFSYDALGLRKGCAVARGRAQMRNLRSRHIASTLHTRTREW